MKPHNIFALISSRRRALGLSQDALAARAGMRREKVNRIESQRIDVGLDELCRLLDAVGLEISVQRKSNAEPAAAVANQHGLVPDEFDKASFIDGSRARIVDWGKIPR